jgi:glycosidase
MKHLFLLVTWVVLMVLNPGLKAMDDSSKEKVPLTIFHAFDLTTEEILHLLPILKRIGYSHIQLMPSQQSRETVPYTDLRDTYLCHSELDEEFCPLALLRPSSDSRHWRYVYTQTGKHYFKRKPWYLHYQPVTYDLTDESKAIILAAHKHSLGVIIDAVLAHIRALDNYEKKDWVEAERQCREHNHCELINTMYRAVRPHLRTLLKNPLPSDTSTLDYIYHWQKGHYVGGWPSGSLPALRQEHPEIKAIRHQFFKDLTKFGVAGIRFDVARSLISDIFNEAKIVNPQFFLYGEVIDNNLNNLGQWRSHNYDINVTAYHLFDRLKQAFSYGQDIRILKDIYKILQTHPTDVTFVATHDTITGGLENYFKMADSKTSKEVTVDSLLAQAFLLGIDIGVPLVLPDYHALPDIQLGVTFRNLMQGEPCEIIDFPNFEDVAVIVKRGDKGIMLINKSDKTFELHDLRISFKKYKSLQPFNGNLPPRSILYFIKK